MARRSAGAPRRAGGIPSPLLPLVIRKVSCRSGRPWRGSGEQGRCRRRRPAPKRPGPATPATSSILTRRAQSSDSPLLAQILWPLVHLLLLATSCCCILRLANTVHCSLAAGGACALVHS